MWFLAFGVIDKRQFELHEPLSQRKDGVAMKDEMPSSRARPRRPSPSRVLSILLEQPKRWPRCQIVVDEDRVRLHLNKDSME
ncbi:hypothetical protein CYJ10_12540 [Cupriavidus pauculus]|uniref:Transposase n=1 Tax=Cupriavidus pauculus TaxID=82633 RepID=A0A2N5CE03_9BURK|nr:hypothetical protein CYJ10_12540 [Cupriavidus pauculus]